MYFIDVRSLKRDLGVGPLDQADVAIYVFLVCGGVPLFYPIVSDPSENLGPFGLSLLASFVIAVLGTVACYRANGRTSGVRFAERFISLSWVVGFRVFLATLLPVVVLRIAAERLYPESDELLRYWLTELPVEALIFWRIYVHIRSIQPGAV